MRGGQAGSAASSAECRGRDALGVLSVGGGVGVGGRDRPAEAGEVPGDRDRDDGFALAALEVQAAAHNRREVVEFLLRKGPDLEFREPFFDATARGVARHFGNDAIVALLDTATY